MTPTNGPRTGAIHWAHHVAKHFEDGQLYLNLRGFDSSDAATAPADALRVLLCSLGIPPRHIPGDPDALAGLYRSVLAGKRILIVLDNARDAEQVRPLLPGSPGCLVIATSRNPLTGLAMTEGARLLTLHLPSVLTARETLKCRLGIGRVITEHRPGRYFFHELIRSYATELSENTDINTERHEAVARLIDHDQRVCLARGRI